MTWLIAGLRDIITREERKVEEIRTNQSTLERQNEMLQAQNEAMRAQNEALRAKIDELGSQINELQSHSSAYGD